MNIEPDHLYLQVLGARKDFGRLYRNLRNMRFYSLGLDELREPESPLPPQRIPRSYVCIWLAY